MTRREFEKMNNAMVKFLVWFVAIAFIWLFLYTVQTLYTINFEKGTKACMQSQGLTLNQCRNLAK
jgi:hypothetical protein